MANILKAPAKVHACEAFVRRGFDAGVPDRIYIGLGDNAGEWGVPASPDIPTDTFDEEQSFWTNCIGIGKVTATDTDMVVPRKIWAQDTAYVIFDPAVDTGSGSFDKITGRNFYVCNTETSPKVYVCTIAGTTTAGNMPTHTNPGGVTEADGVRWEYLYRIGPGEEVPATLLTTSWMPVPTGPGVAYADLTNYVLGDLLEGDDSSDVAGEFHSGTLYQKTDADAQSSGANMAADNNTGNNTWVEFVGAQRLGGFYAGASVVFLDSAGTGGEITNIPYRQVALLRNPRDTAGDRITTQWHGTGTGFEVTLTRGVVMTLDNRVTITRAASQSENIRIILEF